VLDSEYKKQLQAKYTLGLEDDYYNFSKSNKGRFTYDLKDGIAKTLKPTKRKNGIIIEDKVSQDYIVDKIIDIEKRIAFYENKLHKNKKKIKKIIEDIYEDDVNSNNKSNNTENNKIDKTNNNIEDKLKDIVEEDNQISTTTSISQISKFKSNRRLRINN
jgi:hypothetical protein